MKELELEIGVTYQPRSYESVRAAVRVALDEGEDSEKVAQELAKKVARIAEIRILYYQINSLIRVQSPLINRTRQQLAEEFPEAAFSNSRNSDKDG